MTKMSFEELSLKPEMLRAINEMGITDATDVQEKTIPIVRTGSDIFARSQTGTGKTIAFGVPSIEAVDPSIKAVQVLILSPTRELAQQCAAEIRKLSLYLPYVNVAEIYGGADFRGQFRELKIANIVVGTPGRVMDHMRRRTLKLTDIKMVVLDEADEMLNMGFKEDVETILQDAPLQRQIVMFSATIPPDILKISKEFQKEPVNIEINAKHVVLSNIRQCYINLPKNRKLDVLKLLFHRYTPKRVIIFANTKTMVDELAEQLNELGFSTAGLHGDMRQGQRTLVMKNFKQGKTMILVATDVAARGIDVNDVDYVINFDIPKTSDYYVHRIGRTGRAGRAGTAITLCYEGRQVHALRDLAKATKSNVEELPIPTTEDILQHKRSKCLEDAVRLIEKGYDESFKEIVEQIELNGHSIKELAAALLSKKYTLKASDLVDVKASAKSPKSREERKDHSDRSGRATNNDRHFAEIAINIGKADRVAPNHIVGAITEATGINSKIIGKIDITPHLTFVNIPSDIAAAVVETMNGRKIARKPVTVTLVDSGKRSGRGSTPHRRHGKKTRIPHHGSKK